MKRHFKKLPLFCATFCLGLCSLSSCSTDALNEAVTTIDKKIADLLNVSADDLLGLNEEPQTIAAHFDGDEYTQEELDKIKEFAKFVKSSRK